MSGAIEPGDSRQRRVLERIKELDLAHRNRLRPSGLWGAVGLRLLRAYVRSRMLATVPVEPHPVAAPPEGLVIGFGGHATVQIVTAEARILTDPFLAAALWGLRRATALGISEADLDAVDLVLVSSDRADRFHPASLQRLPRAAVLVVPPGLRARAERLGFHDLRVLAPEETLQHRDVTITAVPARHDGGAGVGYLVQDPDVAVLHAGATGYFSGFVDIGRRLRPDVALLPIAGYEPAALRSGNLSPLDAVYACEDLQARWLVPVGYGCLPLGYESFEEPLRWLRHACEERGLQDRLAALTPGQTLRVVRESASSATGSSGLDAPGPVG